MDLGLTGKVALVTGGSEGIGYATAEELAREGARVAICARRPDVLEEAARAIRSVSGNDDVIAVPADVSRAEDIERCVDTVGERLGTVTLLVNNAGTPRLRRWVRQRRGGTPISTRNCAWRAFPSMIPGMRGRRADRQHHQHRREAAWRTRCRLRQPRGGIASPRRCRSSPGQYLVNAICIS
jgi:NAD(P)-dependent dehydrogenase (short-subunit alcohol dehydrogenase family)